MTKPVEPVQLAREAETPPELVRQLQIAKRAVPEPEQLDALASRLAVLLNTPPEGEDVRRAPAPTRKRRWLEAAAAAGVLTKALTAAAVVGVATSGAYVGFRAIQAPKLAAPPAVTTTSHRPSPALAPVAPPPPAPEERKASDTAPILQTEPSLPVPKRPAAQPSGSAATIVDPETLALQRAQQALPSNPGQALALSDAHAREFPRGKLAQEREVIAITALVRLGRTGEATQRASRFRSRFPGSAYLPRLNGLLPPTTP